MCIATEQNRIVQLLKVLFFAAHHEDFQLDDIKTIKSKLKPSFSSSKISLDFKLKIKKLIIKIIFD